MSDHCLELQQTIRENRKKINIFYMYISGLICNRIYFLQYHRLLQKEKKSYSKRTKGFHLPAANLRIRLIKVVDVLPINNPVINYQLEMLTVIF